MSKTVIAIPARYASTRFPGKPLALLAGKPMIQHVYEKAAASKADTVLVATDDDRIACAVTGFGGQAVMTRADHPSGSDRICEAVRGLDCDIVINVQGDEPLIPTAVIDELIDIMRQRPELEMATVVVPATPEKLNNPNSPKVVFGVDRMAIYFSRAVIPYRRDGNEPADYYLHWGIYAYRRKTLERFVSLPPGRLEMCEKLEQLRALENGIGIYVHISNLESIGVDTPQDLAEAEQRLQRKNP
ncbi:MAG: 3-deoxy-manno-octulosonate cytidylyltransferase [Victivallaceae bacterium]